MNKVVEIVLILVQLTIAVSCIAVSHWMLYQIKSPLGAFSFVAAIGWWILIEEALREAYVYLTFKYKYKTKRSQSTSSIYTDRQATIARWGIILISLLQVHVFMSIENDIVIKMLIVGFIFVGWSLFFSMMFHTIVCWKIDRK